MSTIINDVVEWLKNWFYTETEVDGLLNNKQDSLVSGTNIKTVNNNSLLGTGDINTKNVFYGTCSTGASTQTKEVTVSDWVFTTGNVLFVKFTNAQTYNGTAILKIGDVSTDIVSVGTTTTSRYYWKAGELVGFAYDGTNFTMLEKAPATTTYFGITKLSDSVSSTYTSLSATPNAVRQAYELADSKQDELVSGTNIKTINNTSLLGSGDITIGSSGTLDIATDWGSTLSDSKVPSEKLTKNTIDTKIGKEIVTPDSSTDIDTYTTNGFYTFFNNTAVASMTSENKAKLPTGLENKSFYLLVESKNDYIKQTLTRYNNGRTWIRIRNDDNGVDSWSDWRELEVVGHSHTSSDISDFPSIPSKTSDLTNDSNFISTSNTSGLLKNDGTVDTSSYLTTGSASNTYVAKENGKGLFSGSYNDLTNKPTIPNAYVHPNEKQCSYAYSHPSTKQCSATIPSSSSDLSDGSSLVKTSSTSGLIKNDGSIDTNTYLTQHQSLANYVQKSNTNGLLKNDGSIDTNTYLTTHQDISGKINTSDIADNLTTNNGNKVLSAKQGYNLKYWLGDIDRGTQLIGNGLCEVYPLYSINDDFIFMGKLALAYEDDKLCYLKDYDSGRDEIATIGDLNDLVGSAITYINQ